MFLERVFSWLLGVRKSTTKFKSMAINYLNSINTKKSDKYVELDLIKHIVN